MIRVVNVLVLAAVLAAVPLLASCGSECVGCGTTCPVQPGKVFNITLVPSAGLTCKSVPQLTNTLAQISVLTLNTDKDGKTHVALGLTSFTIPLDVSLSGTLCATRTFNTSFVQRNTPTGPITTYSMSGTITPLDAGEPHISGTLSINYSDPNTPSTACSAQASFASST
jgi:hypothetical protein